jgi:hypothetical protein
MKRIINCTPHVINLVDQEGNLIYTVQPSGWVARCSVDKMQVGDISGIPVYRNVYGEVQNLPCGQDGYIFVVSQLVAQTLKDHRDDLVVPDDLVRDQHGNIIGCKGLAKV